MDKSSVLNPSVYWLMFETVIKDFVMLALECAEEQKWSLRTDWNKASNERPVSTAAHPAGCWSSP